jgi:hypothetical protein
VATGRVDLKALPLPDALTAGRKAVVRFETPPRTEIRIDDGAPIGRSEPVALPPGTHRVVFEHPRLGRAERTLDVEAGEERLVKNVFETSERSGRR